MAKIRPFCALRYNREKIPDLSQVVCPPYDVINPSAQEYYRRLSPYNMIHLILGKDVAGEDKYQRAAANFNSWIKERILVADSAPAVYFYNQQFNVRGELKNRLGFIALLRLEDKENKIFPHEHTRLEPKEDRLRLLRRVKANLSPIFVLFSDRKRVIRRTYEQYISDAAPVINVTDAEKVSHKIWKLDCEKALNMLQAQMGDENIFIADGHHRYEVASAFRDKMNKRLARPQPQADYNYILAYFTNIESKGLTIFPIHRLVKKVNDFKIEKFKEAAKEYFDIQEVKEKSRFFFLMEIAGVRENTLGMYKDGKFYLLRLKNLKILDSEISDKPREYRSLDVTILNYIIFKRILGLDPESKDKIIFTPDSNELIAQVDASKSSIGFLLNPVKIDRLVSIARGGERMPTKSTYFYPKVPAGLVINKLETSRKDR